MSKKEKNDDAWVFWLAIVLSIIGVIAIVMMALRVLDII